MPARKVMTRKQATKPLLQAYLPVFVLAAFGVSLSPVAAGIITGIIILAFLLWWKPRLITWMIPELTPLMESESKKLGVGKYSGKANGDPVEVITVKSHTRDGKKIGGYKRAAKLEAVKSVKGKKNVKR